MTPTPSLYLVLSLWLSGCALSLSSGPAHAGQDHRLAASTTLGVSTHAFRHGSSVFGFRLSTAIDRGLAIRSAVLHAGYDVRLLPGRLVFEPGVDLGAGCPMTFGFGGIGSYAGVAGILRLRLLGIDDSEPAFNVYAVSGELIVLSRLGTWMPPESFPDKSMQLEWGVELGVRFAVGSDLVSAAQGKIADSDSTQANGDPP